MDKSSIPTIKSSQSTATSTDQLNMFPILVGILVVFLTLVLFLIYKSKKSARRGILITGLCDSGKTLLYSRLVHRKFVLTQTSIKENNEEYHINGKSLRIIDIPGHERLRLQFLDTHKSTSRGIVYVINSPTIQKDIRDVAEFLYTILTDSVISANTPAILILCNKQDQPLVKNANAIKAMLEKELNTLRMTKASQLQSVDPNLKDKNVMLGSSDDAFSFAGLKFNIEFAESFATNDDNEYNIQDLEKWLVNVS